MEPFYFGPTDRRLFGVYHPPAGRRAAPAGVVLCYPFLQEYFRTHRAFLRLAVQLVGRGWHVLRFDYSGCGDSYGDGPSSPDAWAEDVRLAAHELRQRTGTARMALVGLRLGASLAASVAPSVQPLSDLVLWDPVVNGPDYLGDVLQLRHAATMSTGTLRKMEQLGANDRGLGVELSPAILQSIDRLTLAEQAKACADRILVLDSQDSKEAASFAQRLRDARREVTFERLSERPVWVERKRNDPRNIVVPAASLQAIVNWLSGSGV
jgi:exosortase A-associated hydrolase 2